MQEVKYIRGKIFDWFPKICYYWSFYLRLLYLNTNGYINENKSVLKYFQRTIYIIPVDSNWT